MKPLGTALWIVLKLTLSLLMIGLAIILLFAAHRVFAGGGHWGVALIAAIISIILVTLLWLPYAKNKVKSTAQAEMSQPPTVSTPAQQKQLRSTLAKPESRQPPTTSAPARQEWAEPSTEQGFTLPKSSVKKLMGWQVASIAAGLLLYFFLAHDKASPDVLLFVAGITLLGSFIGFWYLSRYKYVYLSNIGIRGRGARDLTWRRFTWAEPLTSKPRPTSNGLKGYTFTASTNGESINIPAAILQSPEFQSFVSTYAPWNHPFRDLRLTE